MTSHRIRLAVHCLALFILAACFSSVLLNAQTYTEGAIAGTVFDSSGAVIPNSAISIVNNDTNARIDLKADASGFFKAPQVPAGTYTVTVTEAGFSTFKAVNVIVVVNVSTDLNPHLVAGSTTTNVEVSGEAPVLDFETPTISSSLSTHDLEDLPLNGGRWSDMTLLTPGAVGDSNGFGLIAFRGISPILNNVEVDGADDNQAYYSEERGRTREGYSTSKYMVDEFTVNTGVYSAEYGRAAGGVVNAITKSGGNTMHGIAYFSDRDNDWGTVNPFTTTAINTGTSSAPVFSFPYYKPKDWRKEWGFDAGGALKKDKLFWFYGFAQYDRNFPGTAKATSPSTFFQLPDSASAVPGGGTNCSLTTGYMSGLTPTYTTSSNIYSIDQQSCELAARLHYASYQAGVTAYDTQLVGMLADLGTVPRRGYEELNTPKLDWQINEKNHWSILYHRMRWDSPGGVQTQATNDYAIDTFGMDYVKVDYGLTKLDTQVTSNISNEVRYQFGRELDDESQQPVSSYSQQYLEGYNGVTAAGGGLMPNIPEVSLDSPSSTGFYLGSPYYSYRKALPDEHKWQVGDTAAWVKGNHDFKFGVDLVHNYDIMNNTYEGNGVWSYSYLGNYFADLLNEGNAKANGEGACNVGSSITSPTSSSGSSTNYTGFGPCGTMVQGFGPPAWTINTMDYGFFGEDHWKLTPRLTFDLGLRYDYEGLPAPYSNLITTSTATLGSKTYTFTPYLGSSTNGICGVSNANLAVPGQTCPSLAANANLANHPSDKSNFGPRIGISFDPYGEGKTTVRVGYGLYFGRVTNGVLLNNLLDTGSFNGQFVSNTIEPNTFNPPTGTPSASNPYYPLFPNLIPTGGGSGPTSYFFGQGFRNPEVHEFDLSVQQAVGLNTIFQVSYMGALSRELPNALNINLNPNANTSTTTSPNGVTNSIVLVSDSTNAGPITNGTMYTVPTYNGYLNANFGAVNELLSNVNASYNGLVAEIENKSSKLIQFDANYTWSHALDYDQNETTTNISSGFFDPYNIDNYYKGANYGNSAFNVGNRFVGWALMNSPTVSSGNAFVKAISNDWSFNPVFQAQNGLPYSATIGTGYPSYSAKNSSWNGAGTNYWVPFVGRNTYDQPRTMVLDMRLEKEFTVQAADKPYHLELMGELFNAANHPNITGVSTTAYNMSSNSSTTSPCTNPAGGTFGQVGSSPVFYECTVMSYVPQAANAGTAGLFNTRNGFGADTTANSNFAYSVRELMLTMRVEW